MEQFLTFPNIVLLTIFIIVLLLIIGYSVYNWNKDDEWDAFDKFDKENQEDATPPPRRQVPVRSLGETESRIVPSSIHSRSPAQRQALLDILQSEPLDISEYEARRQQLLGSLSNDDIDGDILGHFKSIVISPEPPPVSDYEGDQINPGVYVPRDPEVKT
jgi:hypothetical protein